MYYEQTVKWTAKRKRQFVELLRAGGCVRAAARTLGLSARRGYEQRQADEAFRLAWEDALEDYTERLEAEADRRAIEGVEKGIYYRGDRIATEREYSDTLLLARLKALKPEKYRENSTVKHEGEVGIKRIIIDKSARDEPVEA